MFLIGFILGVVFFLALFPWAVSCLFKKTEKIKPQTDLPRRTESFKNQSVISFSFIMPIMTMALVFAVIVGARITKELFEQGHGDFVFFSLVFPTFSFLIGYLYLKKMVQQ